MGRRPRAHGLDNIIQLCAPHHTFLHEGGWKVTGDPDGELVFVRRDDTAFTGRAPQASQSVVERVTKSATTAMDASSEMHRHQQEERAIEILAIEFDAHEKCAVKTINQKLDRNSGPLVTEPEPSWGDDLQRT